MTFDKDTKAIQWGKGSFQQMVLGKLDVHVQKYDTAPLHNIMGKKITQLDQRPK